ncbi:MAG: ATP-binding protein [Bacteroidota bacterium]
MIKRIIYIISFLLGITTIAAQQSYTDSLQHEITISKNDTIRLVLFGKLADIYSELNPDSTYHYGEKMLNLAKKLDLKLEEVIALNFMGYGLLNLGNYPRSLQYLLSAISISEDPKSEMNILPGKYIPVDEFGNRSGSPRMQRLTILSRTLQYAGILYGNAGNYEKAIYYYKIGLPLAQQANNLPLVSITYMVMGRAYLSLKNNDSALFFLEKGYESAVQANYNRYMGSILLNMGRVYLAKGKQEKAREYFRRAMMQSEEHNYFRGVVASNLALADLYKNSGNADSSLYFIRNGLPLAYYLNAPDLLLRSYTALADYYKTSDNNDSAVKYQSLIIKINDSLFNSKQAQQFQNIDFDEQQRLQQVEAAKKAYQNKVRQYALLAGLGGFLLLAFILYRNNRQKQKANLLLAHQKQKVESTLMELKSTQAQLIQSAKMASLGELTAGIAHEIQNPLNFVNNFSEVNKELIGEMKTEIAAGNFDEVKIIADDIESNEEKINHHGKRADAIVKGMLQHSRSSSGVKEPIDINALCDEYLRLSYHGLRAKDKSFNATMKTDFDESIGNINIISQDIGRVVLNLLTNAFYVVDEKKKASTSSAGQPYEPTVSISTKKTGDKVLISVSDNGNGIPQKVLDKIFQPFFTTKPTGQGTGLGLSLSYDIVKAHGGEIKVETRPVGQAGKESEGSTFIIQLPASI